jgi:hypothetical protein
MRLKPFGQPRKKSFAVSSGGRGVGAAADIFKSLLGSWVLQILPGGKFCTRCFFLLKHDSTGLNHARRPRSCLSMISAQTPLAFVARENRFPLFRIMLQAGIDL